MESIKQIKDYLHKYRRMNTRLANIEDEIATIKAILADVSVAISRYGTEPGGGSSELNAVESAANQRLKVSQRLHELERERLELSGLLTRIDRALDMLDDRDRYIVKAHYIDGMRWQDIAMHCYYSEHGVRNRAYRALSAISDMVSSGDMYQVKLWIT